MKNSLFLAPRFPPYPGGAETYASDLTSHLAEYGWNSFVITDTQKNFMPGTKANKNMINPIFLETPTKDLEDINQVKWRVLQFGLLTNLDKIISKLPNIHLVHANSIEAAILGRIIADQLQVPLVATIHEHSPEKQPFGIGRCQLAFQRLGIDALIAPSEFYFTRAIKLGFPPKRIHKITHGVSESRLSSSYREKSQRQRNNSCDPLVAVLIGRIYEPKGISILIEAARILKDDKRFKAIVVGPDGPGGYADEVRKRIKIHNLEDTVQLMGEVLPSTIPTIISNADIIVAPSLNEGFGLAVVEAMLLGKPVIVSNVGGLSQVVKDNVTGLFINPGDAHTLATSISKLMNSPTLAKKLSKAAKQDALERFSADRMALETANVYDQLLKL